MVKRSIPGRYCHTNSGLAYIVLPGKPKVVADFKIFEKKRITRRCYGMEGGNPKIFE